jgi:CubicO group peptidase (beta-lactamase class C family)
MPHTDLPRSTPEAQGIPSSAILDFLDAIGQDPGELHSLIVARHGRVVAEGYWAPYTADRQHLLYSLSKSFTSTAAGMAVDEGKLSLDDPVLKFFPDDAPAEVSPNLAAMRVRHLLMMGGGHSSEPEWKDPDGNWARAFLAAPVEHEPGTHFLYNTAGTYMVSAIVKKATGQDIVEYLGPRLFAPLGIADPRTERCPRGIPVGGTGMYLTTNDIAKLGQLYLQKGVWQGKRLLSEAYVAEATSKRISNGTNPEDDWQQGYGYQFWCCRHGVYRGDGAFGQFCVVMPAQDAVVAITSGVENMARVLQLVWEHLLPAMVSAPLPADSAASGRLSERLASLAIRTPEGQTSSPAARTLSDKTFRFASNDQKIETMHFDFGSDATLVVHDGEGEHTVVIGIGAWREGTTTFLKSRVSSQAPADTLPSAGQGAWTGEHTFVAKICLLDAPFCPTLTFDFSAGRLAMTLKGSVGFGASERKVIVGE